MADEMLLPRITSIRVELMDGGIFAVSSFTLKTLSGAGLGAGKLHVCQLISQSQSIHLMMSGALKVC